MINQRLVKLALPSELVVAMDTYINTSSSYNGRQDFVADAIANLLADLEVGGVAAEAPLHDVPSAVSANGVGLASSAVVSDSSQSPAASIPSVVGKTVEPFETSTALALARISFPSEDLLRSEGIGPSPSEVTWGIHNRDFPTLWAAGMLSRELTTHESVDYQNWLAEAVDVAWRLAASLADSDIDLSGFPMNLDKADKSESRFVRFFLGETAGHGPLFDLGLVAEVESGRVAMTLDGANVLAQLEGWAPTVSRRPADDARDVFLSHLFWRVPADFNLMQEIVDLISEGFSDRDTLIAEIGSRNAGWSSGVTTTNVAGFIGRARQWGLIERRQTNRRYQLSPGAVAAIHAYDNQRTEEPGE
jgi:hypothetical protein